MKKVFNQIPSIILFSLPLLFVFGVMLLAFYPGIMSPDAMVQWNQVQTNSINNWHPAYTTLFIKLLTIVWNSPTFIIIIQDLIIAFIVSYTLTRLHKYYKVPRKYLFIISILFACNPLNFNFAVNMLKDTLFSYFLLLMLAFILDIINDKKWLTKWYNVLFLILDGLLINLFRHNGILITIMLSVIIILVFKKKKILYLVCLSWLIFYLLLTNVGFKVLNIQDNSTANKFGPITHIFGQILNNDNITLSDNEIKELSKYADINKLKDTFHSYNMDFSINTQNINYIANNKLSYLKFALSVFHKYPFEIIKYYAKLDSFLYSPIPFKDSIVAGMFNESELYLYEDTYPELKENSKILWLNKLIKKVTQTYQSGIIGILTMRPAIYMYLSIACVIYLVKVLKNKKYFYFYYLQF